MTWAATVGSVDWSVGLCVHMFGSALTYMLMGKKLMFFLQAQCISFEMYHLPSALSSLLIISPAAE